MSTIEWGLRWETGDGYEQAPMASESAARSAAEEMRRSYPWPDEIKVIRREVSDWTPE